MQQSVWAQGGQISADAQCFEGEPQLHDPQEKGLPMEKVISSIKKYGTSSLALSEGHCTVKDNIKSLKSLRNHGSQASVSATAADITADLQSLEGQLASFGSDQYFRDALGHVAVLKHQFQQDAAFRESADKAIVSIESMESVSIFLRELLRPGSPLLTGDGFVGTLHCELLLAILMAMSQYRSPDHPISPEILNMLFVSRSLLLACIFLTWMMFRVLNTSSEYRNHAAQRVYPYSLFYQGITTMRTSSQEACTIPSPHAHCQYGHPQSFVKRSLRSTQLH
jgi:hypothetical protein